MKDNMVQVGLDTHTVGGVYGDESPNTFEKEIGLRRVERLINDNWVRCSMCELHIGDKFKLFEDDGSPAHKDIIWTACSEPYVDFSSDPIYGTWGIEVETEF